MYTVICLYIDDLDRLHIAYRLYALYAPLLRQTWNFEGWNQPVTLSNDTKIVKTKASKLVDFLKIFHRRVLFISIYYYVYYTHHYYTCWHQAL